MEFAWNTQKNKLSDVKGKEKEQNREGKIRNDDIDLDKTKFNFDFVSDSLNLYQRVKKRIDDVRDVSRIQKNSVVMYSNVITINKDTHKVWGDSKSKEYFKEVYQYFCNEFGKENVVSAKVHLDETTPHMHLHFVPISKEGKLQARKVMTPSRINSIHTNAPKYLQSKGFDVVRGKGITHKDNIKDIHEYKLEKLIDEVTFLENKKLELTKNIADIEEVHEVKNINVKEKKGILRGSKVEMDINDYEYIQDTLKSFRERIITLEKENFDLKQDNKFYKDREKKIFSIKERNIKLEDDNLEKSTKLFNKQLELKHREDKVKFHEVELKKERDSIIKIKEELEVDKNQYKYLIEKEIKDEYIQKIEDKEKEINKIKDEYSGQLKKSFDLFFKSEFRKDNIDFFKLLSKQSSNIINEYSKVYGDRLLNSIIKNTGKDFDYRNSYISIDLDVKSLDEKFKQGNLFKFNDAITCLSDINIIDQDKKSIMRYKLYNHKKELIHIDEVPLIDVSKDLLGTIISQMKESNNFLVKDNLINNKQLISQIDNGIEL